MPPHTAHTSPIVSGSSLLANFALLSQKCVCLCKQILRYFHKSVDSHKNIAHKCRRSKSLLANIDKFEFCNVQMLHQEQQFRTTKIDMQEEELALKQEEESVE